MIINAKVNVGDIISIEDMVYGGKRTKYKVLEVSYMTIGLPGNEIKRRSFRVSMKSGIMRWVTEDRPDLRNERVLNSNFGKDYTDIDLDD